MMRALIVSIALLLASGMSSLSAAPVGTTFSYQGQLDKEGSPYTGPADFVFRLYDDAGAGTQIGSDVAVAALDVSDGIFTALIDFGSVFGTTALWLEVHVKTPGDGDYTTLTPRHPLTASPFAVRALNGPAGSSQWTNSANGIEYTAGNVGMGTPGVVAHPGRKLWIDTGSSSLNPAWFRNNNANLAALAIQNDAVNGYGLYDAWSDYHYVTGYVGVNKFNPEFPIDVDSGAGRGIRSTVVGDPFVNGAAAITAVGLTGDVAGSAAMGVFATSVDKPAVYGVTTNYWGVGGLHVTGNTLGILGTPTAGVFAQVSLANQSAGEFINTANGVAVRAVGTVKASRVEITGGADLVEGFDTTGDVDVEPGTVMVIDSDHPGRLRACAGAYDRRVAGVVSGAGGIEPGLRLRQEGALDGDTPIAMSGRVYVKCSAENGAIRPGDLLTTAARPGHAMRAGDDVRAHGSVIGKAMTGLEDGTGLVLMLINLQ